MNTSAEHNLETRALFFRKVREYFRKKNVLEVDVPILNPYAPIDRHIEVIKTSCGYLHTSPEYGIKILLSKIQRDMFAMSHVFRKNEKGALHNQEFTMVEWYRLSKEYFSFIEEVLDFCLLFLGSRNKTFITYDDAFLQYAAIDLETAQEKDFGEALENKNISYSDKVDLKDLVLTSIIEPQFTKENLTVLFDYPKEEAALAKTYHNGKKIVAKRFEIYCQGVELANGYDELADKNILKERLENESVLYQKNFQTKLEIDPALLNAMSTFPQCCGVAVGFDRLLMLHLQKKSIQEILPLTLY